MTGAPAPAPQQAPAAPSDLGLRFFIGVTTAAIPNWQRFFAEPQAPDRYGAEAARKFVEEKRQKQEEKAVRAPISGYIKEAVVLNGTGEEEFRARCMDDNIYSASYRLMEFITGSRRTGVSYLSTLPSSEDVQVRWFGFDIRDVMQMMALTCMAYNGTATNSEAKVKIPAGVWYYRHFSPAPFIDPYETLVPSSLRDDVDAFGLCEYLGIEVPPTVGEDPAAKAELARQLALRGQFWPVDKENM